MNEPLVCMAAESARMEPLAICAASDEVLARVRELLSTTFGVRSAPTAGAARELVDSLGAEERATTLVLVAGGADDAPAVSGALAIDSARDAAGDVLGDALAATTLAFPAENASLREKLGARDAELASLEERLQENLESMRTFHKQQQQLFDNFVVLRTKVRAPPLHPRPPSPLRVHFVRELTLTHVRPSTTN